MHPQIQQIARQISNKKYDNSSIRVLHLHISAYLRIHTEEQSSKEYMKASLTQCHNHTHILHLHISTYLRIHTEEENSKEYMKASLTQCHNHSHAALPSSVNSDASSSITTETTARPKYSQYCYMSIICVYVCVFDTDI